MLIAGNWKMFKGPREAAEFCRALRDADLGDVDVVVCPPYVSLAEAVQALAGDRDRRLRAERATGSAEGAFTGEVSAPMLRELGVYGTIVGHSERRQYFGETDETVARRAAAALEHGPARDRLRRRDRGRARGGRDRGGAPPPGRRSLERRRRDLVIAYEPVWAIGTGKTATPEMAQEAHAFDQVAARRAGALRRLGQARERRRAARRSRDVDGALVGGASLDVESFAAICRAASHS